MQHKGSENIGEVVTRRKQNTLLREAGMWDKLEPIERSLAVAPDGDWNVEQQSEVLEVV